MSELDILYEDDALIALNKPAGLLVHPSWIAPKKTPNCASMLKEYLGGATIHTIHRLDRATSGVILFGKHKEAAQVMHDAFAERKVDKTYLAMVRGYTPESDTIDYALKEKIDKKEDSRTRQDKPAQDAVTAYQRIATVELPIAVSKFPTARYSLVQCKPETGRKHQIRRHMKHIFHPIVGDTKHGDGRHNIAAREHMNIHRLMLMATQIRFQHPMTKELLSLTAPVSEEVDQLFASFGWQGLYPAP